MNRSTSLWAFFLLLSSTIGGQLAAQEARPAGPRPRFEPMLEEEGKEEGAMRKEAAPRRGASIFQRKQRQKPTLEKHMLIQVTVEERATAKGDSREDTSARASADLEIASYLKFKDGNLANGTNPLALDVEADKRRQLRDQNQRSIDIKTRIAARIMDILPNGNVRIEARSERRINEELTVMTLTGEVRADDISPDLVISSDRIADLKLTYSAANPRTKKTRRNLVERLLIFLWPF